MTDLQSDLAALREVIKLAEIAKDQPSPDVANVSDAEYKLVCRFHKAIPALERLIKVVEGVEAKEQEWREDDPDLLEEYNHARWACAAELRALREGK